MGIEAETAVFSGDKGVIKLPTFNDETVYSNNSKQLQNIMDGSIRKKH